MSEAVYERTQISVEPKKLRDYDPLDLNGRIFCGREKPTKTCTKPMVYRVIEVDSVSRWVVMTVENLGIAPNYDNQRVNKNAKSTFRPSRLEDFEVQMDDLERVMHRKRIPTDFLERYNLGL